MLPGLTPIICLALSSCAALPAGYESRLSTWERMRDGKVAASSPDSGALAENADLSQLLQYARLNNPGLEAAFQRWKEALEKVPQATTLPEPRLSFGGYLSEVETRVGPMQARAGLTQPFPWFGELELAGNVALHLAWRWRYNEFQHQPVQKRHQCAVRIVEDIVKILTNGRAFELLICARLSGVHAGSAGVPINCEHIPKFKHEYAEIDGLVPPFVDKGRIAQRNILSVTCLRGT